MMSPVDIADAYDRVFVECELLVGEVLKELIFDRFGLYQRLPGLLRGPVPDEDNQDGDQPRDRPTPEKIRRAR